MSYTGYSARITWIYVHDWSFTGVRTWMDCLLVTLYILHVNWVHTVIAVAIPWLTAPHHWACLARCRSWCLLIKWQCRMLNRAVLQLREHRTSKRLIVDACRMLKTVCISTECHRRQHDGRRRDLPSYLLRRCHLLRYHYRMPATPAFIIPVYPARPLAIRWTWYSHSITIHRHHRNHPGHQNLRRNLFLRIWGFPSR